MAIRLGAHELEIVVPGGTSVLQELKELKAGNRLSGLSGCSGQVCQHVSSNVATMEVQKVKSFRFGQLLAMIVKTTHNVVTMTAQMRQQIANSIHTFNDYDTSDAASGHSGASEFRHLSDVQASLLPLNIQEIFGLTITVRGQTLTLEDFVGVHLNSVDDFISWVDAFADTAEGQNESDDDGAEAQ